MRRLGWIVVCLSVISLGSVRAQMYVSGSAGYGFPFATDELTSPFVEVGALNLHIESSGITSVRRTFGTLGSGVHIAAAVGYQINKYIAVDIDFSFVRSPGISLAQYISPTYQATHDVHTWRLQLTPQLVLNTGGKKLRGFVKSGFILPLYGEVKSTIAIHDEEGRVAKSRFGLDLPGLQTDLNAKATTTPRFSYGFRSAMGIEWQISNRVCWYNELYFSALSIVAKQSTITFYDQTTTKDGQLLLRETTENMSEFVRRTDYVRELNENSNNAAYNSAGVKFSEPAEELIFKENYNNAGWMTGFRFLLGKKGGKLDENVGFDSL